MIPLLDSIWSGVSVDGGVSSISGSMTIGNLGKNGLVVICAIGREQTGDHDPEEINNITFNGIPMELIFNANRNEFGCTMYVLRGASIPPAGTYTVQVNYKGSNTAEFHKAVGASFKYVKDQVAEVSNHSEWSDGSHGSGAPHSTLTNNALVIACWGWRVGFAETWSYGTPLVTLRVDNQAGITMSYAIEPTPRSFFINCNATNPEDNGIIAASFAFQKVASGQIL